MTSASAAGDGRGSGGGGRGSDGRSHGRDGRGPGRDGRGPGRSGGGRGRSGRGPGRSGGGRGRSGGGRGRSGGGRGRSGGRRGRSGGRRGRSGGGRGRSGGGRGRGGGGRGRGGGGRGRGGGGRGRGGGGRGRGGGGRGSDGGGRAPVGAVYRREEGPTPTVEGPQAIRWRARRPSGWRSAEAVASIPTRERARQRAAIGRSDQGRSIGGPGAISRSDVISETILHSPSHFLTVKMNQPNAADGAAVTSPSASWEPLPDGPGTRKMQGHRTRATPQKPASPNSECRS